MRSLMVTSTYPLSCWNIRIIATWWKKKWTCSAEQTPWLLSHPLRRALSIHVILTISWACKSISLMIRSSNIRLTCIHRHFQREVSHWFNHEQYSHSQQLRITPAHWLAPPQSIDQMHTPPPSSTTPHPRSRPPLLQRPPRLPVNCRCPAKMSRRVSNP